MLLFSDHLSDVPILSLQTGSELARTSEAIIDPRQLLIVALYVQGPSLDISPAVLHISDIREVSQLGYIVDGNERLMELDGLVRLQEIIDFHFTLIGLPVYDRSNTKLGKVHDFTFDPDGFFIQQIYIKPSLMRSFSSTSNIASRKQVISVNSDRIIIDTPTVTEKITQRAQAAADFVNPFRTHTPQPDHERTDRS